MTIKLELDDEVARLIEYIPEELISEILSNLIKQGIYAKSSIQANDEQIKSSTEDINKVITLIEQLSMNGKTSTISVKEESTYTPNTIQLKEDVVEVQKAPTVISLTGLDDEDLDDDLLSLIK